MADSKSKNQDILAKAMGYMMDGMNKRTAISKAMDESLDIPEGDDNELNESEDSDSDKDE